MKTKSEAIINVNVQIPCLHMNKRIILSAVICFAIFYLFSSTLFMLLLSDFGTFSVLEGQIRQLAILVTSALIGACSAPILRRFVKREDYRSYLAFFVILFIVVLIIGCALFYLPVPVQTDESRELLWYIFNAFPQMLHTVFSLPALIAQFITLSVINKFSSKSATV